ncbi:MAG TPA: Gfo/Idh/MocA family oxidoreductase [Pyrinomonadaceae bacterium]|nr:Gfo/Idh/MocA family oxidoreductase [Pyrinomonadaceae bacterium]
MRAAVIGLGRHGMRHLQAYQRLENVEIVAVCDVRPENVAAAVAELPTARGYDDWRQLLSNERLDVISVVTNGPTHAPITIAAAENGVGHVLCEKPFATSVADGLRMIAACKNRGTRLAVCHGRRWVSSYQQLRDLIAGGLIGNVCHFWFTCGGGLFAGNGTHFMDLARMLSGGNPVLVTATVDNTGTPNPRGAEFQDPGAVAVYRFNNGMRMVIDMFEDLGVPPRIEIVGSIGRILIDEVEGRWEIVARAGDDREKPVGQYWLPLVREPFEPVPLDMVEILVSGLEELLGGGPISCTGVDGLTTLEMVIGAHVSSLNGGVPIRLPLSDEYHEIDIPLT